MKTWYWLTHRARTLLIGSYFSLPWLWLAEISLSAGTVEDTQGHSRRWQVVEVQTPCWSLGCESEGKWTALWSSESYLLNRWPFDWCQSTFFLNFHWNTVSTLDWHYPTVWNIQKSRDGACVQCAGICLGQAGLFKSGGKVQSSWAPFVLHLKSCVAYSWL